jgi:osmoprotectant transport system permease protein
MTSLAAAAPATTFRLDKLGVLIALLAAAGALLQPLMLFRANRIVPGEGRSILEALPPLEAGLLAATITVGVLIALLRTRVVLRLVTSIVVIAVLLILAGRSATWLTPAGHTFARVAPGAGFWIVGFAFALMLADALTRRRLAPAVRVGILLAIAAGLGLLLGSGAWNDLSILKEYANRAEQFWAEAGRHVFLAFGSLLAAAVVGIPLGILSQRINRVRAGILNVLNIVQTIPSIALFGLLIAPLAWVAAAVPGAAAIGIAGIGPAPALVALFFYSLLPIVANTVVGIEGVAPAAVDAARGMGMTGTQRLLQVELPLAFPVILTGIRIVLVQNIGLATIAALIGGGGLGQFVFQGIGQTAMDLVLLGAVPTVALAFAAAVVLDAAVELVSVRRRGR